MKILVIPEEMPYPAIAGTPLRTYNVLYRVAQQHDVWLVTFAATTEQAESAAHFKEFCREVIVIHTETSEQGVFSQPVKLLQYLLSGRPPDLRLYESEELIAAIRSLTARVDFDVAEIVQSYMAFYLDTLPPALQRRTILTLHDIVFAKYDRIYRVEPKPGRKMRQWLHSRMMRRWEPRYLERFARCLVMSSVDGDVLLSANPRIRVDVVPNGVDTAKYNLLPYAEEAPNLLYVGNMGYRPNIDAVVFFCNEVLPLVRREVPGVKLWIVGINPTPEVYALAGDDVHVTGRVEDVQPYYAMSKVCVVPLRAGGGTRLKILESMALGRAVVSTSVGAEGIDAVDGEHILIGDTAEALAAHTVRLLTDAGLREALARRARELVVSKYDWQAIAARQLEIYEQVVQG
ncbi:MAG: glycosyltransferase [Anaerolineae bacterium]|nr:glycosyltransferase [Anaerolineae bacterium]